jgi:NAD(P)-dependent dehydrogenase (short-subunit alcohol dehydrogenase family)
VDPVDDDHLTTTAQVAGCPAVDVATWGFEQGAVAIVTGAASGIGRATAIRCAHVGLRVAAWDVDARGLDEVADEIHAAGGTVETALVDVFDDGAIDAAFAAVEAAWQPARHLVNNAGPRSVDPYSFREGLDRAVGSMESMIRRFLAGQPGPGASVVNVSSVAGNLAAGAAPAWYATSKAAIAGLTRALAFTDGRDCRFNAVAPSLVATPRMTSYMESENGRRWADTNPLGRWADSDDVAGPILFLLSPFAGYVNGVLLPIDGGQTLVL